MQPPLTETSTSLATVTIETRASKTMLKKLSLILFKFKSTKNETIFKILVLNFSKIVFNWSKNQNFSFKFCTYSEGSPSVPHPPQFNISVPHRWATLFQPPKSLSSTPKTPQFNTFPNSTPKRLSSTPKFSDFRC